MKPFVWNEEKNKWLQKTRGISFEEILQAIASGGVLYEYEHPRRAKYPNQFILIVQIRTYVYVVAYVEDKDKRFLKTAYPSRKAKKLFYKNKEEYEKKNV